jgi:hypothetical protein
VEKVQYNVTHKNIRKVLLFRINRQLKEGAKELWTYRVKGGKGETANGIYVNVMYNIYAGKKESVNTKEKWTARELVDADG